MVSIKHKQGSLRKLYIFGPYIYKVVGHVVNKKMLSIFWWSWPFTVQYATWKITNIQLKICGVLIIFLLIGIKRIKYRFYLWLLGDNSSNIFNKNGSTIRFNELRRQIIKGLKQSDLQELKDSLEGKSFVKW